MAERQRVVRRDERTERGKLGKREADGGEPRVDAALEGAGGVEDVDENGHRTVRLKADTPVGPYAGCRKLLAYSTTVQTSSLLNSLLNAGILGSLRPFHTL